MPDLSPLYKLHQVDAAMVEAKNRHDHMDPGREIAAEIQAAGKEHEAAKKAAEDLARELTDLELKQRSVQEKIAKFDKQLYGGSVVNPREVENIQKEIALLKEQRDSFDERILELWELIPPAKDQEKNLGSVVEALKAKLAEHQKKVHEERARLAAEYKALAAKRPGLAGGVDPGLLQTYETNRQKHGGIGMAEITPSGTCSRCGMAQPRKTIELAALDYLVTCENCRRILFKVVPDVA